MRVRRKSHGREKERLTYIAKRERERELCFTETDTQTHIH